MDRTIYIIIISIIVFNYLLEQFLEYLNKTYWSNKLPPDLEGIYSAEKYKKSQDYYKANKKLSFISGTLSFVLILLMLHFKGFAIVDNYIRQFTVNPILLALLFFGIFGLASDILSTPFSIYDTFVIEEKYGFNKVTPKLFVLDKLKSLLLGAVIGGVLLSVVVLIYEFTGNWFWFITWMVITAFTIFMTMFYSTLIVPIFNKQTPLEEGELRDAIEAFSKKVGFKLSDIYVIDGSKRSKKANAYFSGLGSKKRIVLYDTLIKENTVEELVAVLAHEIGHYKLKHTRTGIIIGIIQTGLMLFILSLFIQKGSAISLALAKALGSDIPSFHLGILAFGLLYTPLSLILGLALNIVSRKNEYQADKFAGENYNSEALQTALKKLSVNNLSNLNPHPVYVFFYYSHPTLLQRLNALKKIKNN